MSEIPGALLDALIDTAKLLPILFLTYLAMEAIEHYAGERTYAWIKKARGAGPLLGGLIGIIPQCGFAGGEPLRRGSGQRGHACGGVYCNVRRNAAGAHIRGRFVGDMEDTAL